MNSKELVLEAIRRYGKQAALNLQENAASMTSTELNSEDEFIPLFDNNRQYLIYDVGYICKSAAGAVVELLQPYDSLIYADEPENLSAQWKFHWSTDPQKAKPFLSSSTSTYMLNDCCTYDEHIWQSGQDNNVWAPGTTGVVWNDLGLILDIM